MAKEDKIQIEGIVLEVLPNKMFRVELDNESIITAGRRLTLKFIKILQGDKVTVELSPYDLAKGKIISRNKQFFLNIEII